MPFSARKMRTRRGFGAGCSHRASRDPASSNCCRHAAGYRGTAATSLAGTGGSIILAIPILMCRSGDLSAFVDRPADIKRLIHFMLSMFPAAPDIDRPRIGFYGFSRGGYTGLVSFGGNPDWACATEFCQRSSAYCCEKIRRKSFLSRPRTRPAAQSWRHRRPLSLFSLLATVLRRSACRCSSRPPNLAATA